MLYADNSNIQKAKHYIRYIIAGFFTTLVNYVSFCVCHYLIHLDIDTANVLSVITAVLFAYFANKSFVFQTPYISLKSLGRELISFVLSRLTTMVIEVVGVNLIYNYVFPHALAAKVAVSIIVLALNYVLSHYFVFTKK